MELIYITHGNILSLHAIAAWLSWPIVVGGAYGAFRLVVDAVKLIGRVPENLDNITGHSNE